MKELTVNGNGDQKIVFDLPSKDSRGFLRRQRELSTFQKMLRDKPDDPNTLNSLVNYLVGFIVEPEDRKEAKEILWDMSKAEYDELLTALFVVPDAEVPPKS